MPSEISDGSDPSDDPFKQTPKPEIPDFVPEWLETGVSEDGEVVEDDSEVELTPEVRAQRNAFMDDMNNRVAYAEDNQSTLPEGVSVMKRKEGQTLLRVLHPDSGKTLSGGDFGVLIDDIEGMNPDPDTQKPVMSVTRTFWSKPDVFSAQRVNILPTGKLELRTTRKIVQGTGEWSDLPPEPITELRSGELLEMFADMIDRSSGEVGFTVPPVTG